MKDSAYLSVADHKSIYQKTDIIKRPIINGVS